MGMPIRRHFRALDIKALLIGFFSGQSDKDPRGRKSNGWHRTGSPLHFMSDRLFTSNMSHDRDSCILITKIDTNTRGGDMGMADFRHRRKISAVMHMRRTGRFTRLEKWAKIDRVLRDVSITPEKRNGINSTN